MFSISSEAVFNVARYSIFHITVWLISLQKNLSVLRENFIVDVSLVDKNVSIHFGIYRDPDSVSGLGSNGGGLRSPSALVVVVVVVV